MFPEMINKRICDLIDHYQGVALGWKLSGAGGGGYLLPNTAPRNSASWGPPVCVTRPGQGATKCAGMPVISMANLLNETTAQAAHH